jgi:hypothetical protein
LIIRGVLKGFPLCWWNCQKAKCDHHVWIASVGDRTNGENCPFCSGRKTCKCDSFAQLYPELLKEFDYKGNQGLDPYAISRGSHIKCQWKCSNCEYQWSATLNSRTSSKTGCPRCRFSHLEKK